jgi:hypothetical protein
MKLTIPVLLLLVAFFFAGCAQTLLRDPKTGAVVDCDAESSKSTPAAFRGNQNPFPLAFAHRGCIDGYKAAGYKCAQGVIFCMPIQGEGC